MVRQPEQGQTGAQICREHSISEATFYAWNNKFGSMSTSELQHLKHLENESRCLNQLYAELRLENQVINSTLTG